MPADSSRDQTRRWVMIGASVAIAYAIFRAAWMSDDALLNVRTALNVAHDNGAVYNVGERVQVYTSPLWFWLSFVVGFLTDEYVLGTLALAMLCSTVAAAVMLRSAVSTTVLVAAAGVVIVSPTLLDYSTSGLENPLAYLLCVALVALATADRLRPLLVGAVVAALLLTRLDFVLLAGPLVAWLVWENRARPRQMVILGAATVAPAAIWHAVAFAYYGSALPNSYYAKTNLDISRVELLVAGVRYLVESAEFDRVGVVAGLILLVVVSLKSPVGRAVALGCGLYISYVVWVGGDFMAGRFLAVPLFLLLATWVRTGSVPSLPPVAIGAAVVLLLGLGADQSGVFAPRQRGLFDLTDAGVVVDEASFYRGLNYDIVGSLDELSSPEAQRTGIWRLRTNEKAWRQFTPPATGLPRAVEPKCGGLGGLGLERNADTYMLDSCGLADPVLARLPYRPPERHTFRAGHYDRGIPDGYIEALTLADPALVVDAAIRALVIETWADVRP